MLVASDEATAGSVMAKQLLISPRSRGSSHSRFCSTVPYLHVNTQVSPALQGAVTASQLLISHSGRGNSHSCFCSIVLHHVSTCMSPALHCKMR